MNTILKIIEKKGGLEKLIADGHFKIENKPYMSLSIDYVGNGPNGLPMVAVAHNYEQNGDLMADLDMQCEVGQGLNGELELYPVTFQQDSLGVFQSVYTLDDNGKVKGFFPRLKKELQSFLKQWGANLKNQGFLEIA